MEVLETLVSLQRASGATVAIGAHEAFATDSVTLVLAPADLTGPFGAHPVATGVRLPPVDAFFHVVHLIGPGVGADPGVGLGQACQGHHQ